MRIVESDISYDIDDIIEQISNELGFSIVKMSETEGYFILGGGLRLFINFEGDIDISLKLPFEEIDLSDSLVRLDTISDSLESASEIVKIVRRMTAGGM